MHESADQLLSQLKTLWRYRWHTVAVTWFIAVSGWTVVYLIPDRYEAQARVYVDTQSMLRPLLSGLAVQPNAEQMVTMMGRTLINRLNVEKVIRMADMDIGLIASEDRQKMASHMMKALEIRSTGRENLYTIAYTDHDRERAKRVVQSLLTIFMEGNVGDKRRDSDLARNFIEEQLQNYSEKLVAAEKAVTEFKRRHQAVMPGAGRDYYARLSDAKTALSQGLLELRVAVTSRDAIKQQLAGDARISSRPGDQGSANGPTPEIDIRIQTLEQRLDGLRLTYTEEHPDVVALVRSIAQLKEQKMEKTAKPDTEVPRGPAYQQLMVALASAEANVAAMTARAAEYRVRYQELQEAANAFPQVEAEYKQLTRDYDVIKDRYDKLLERRESAQISGDVAASDAALGFRVIDPPQVPLAPSQPNRLQLMSLVLLAALGGGLGFAFLIGQIRPTFNDERRLREASGLKVLGSVAMASNDDQKKRRRRGLFALLLSFLSLLSTYFAIMASLMMTVARV